jgi:hypothetical protein
MASRRRRVSLAEFLQLLPYGLRAQIEDYLHAVRDAMPGIAEDAGVRLTPESTEQLMVLAALKKLFVFCDSHRWILDRSLAILREHDISGFRVGTRVVNQQSPEVSDARRFMTEFSALLRSRGLENLSKESLSTLLKRIDDGSI